MEMESLLPDESFDKQHRAKNFFNNIKSPDLKAVALVHAERSAGPIILRRVFPAKVITEC